MQRWLEGYELMKKFAISLIILVALMCLCSCKNDPKGSHLLEDIEALSTELHGMSQSEVHEFLGAPVGELSGFWGDIYHNSENQSVIVYYDENGKVEFVKRAD